MSDEIRGVHYLGIPYIDYMLALIALAVIWTCAAWHLTDRNAVDVAGGASHVNGLFWIVFRATSSSIDHKHSKIRVSDIKAEGYPNSPLRCCSM